MSDPRAWPFDSPDMLRIPFIFVPHGAPEPREWLAGHPGAIKIPARFVPRGNAGGAIETDFNEALMTWLAREVGDDGTAPAQPDQGGGGVKPRARLANLLASNAFEANAGSPSGTNLDAAQMKFLLGAYGNTAETAPLLERRTSESLAGTWLADWRPPQTVPPGASADQPPSHPGPKAHDASHSPAVQGAKKLTQAEMLKLARMRAMLRLIRWDDNKGASDEKAYHARFGNHDSMTDNEMINYIPKPEYFKDRDGTPVPYTAAGAYQIIGTTWNRVSQILDIKNFTPADQDRIASFLIGEASATADIEAGNLTKAIRELNGTWRALAGGSQTRTDIVEDKKNSMDLSLRS
jgi:muramidase (phage lysozyme)